VPESVVFHVGPVASDIASGWLANSRGLVAGVRAHRRELTISVHDDLLDLCDMLLDVWTGCASRDPVFDWSMSTDTETVVQVVGQWLEIGALTDADLTRIGCTWAPDWTRPFADALVAGASAALTEAGARGEVHLRRLQGEG
jgi:hypothetical protein